VSRTWVRVCSCSLVVASSTESSFQLLDQVEKLLLFLVTLALVFDLLTHQNLNLFLGDFVVTVVRVDVYSA
jgi:hypothetical protein